jgi:hypothetical protein
MYPDRSRGRGQRGQSLVIFALIAVVLFAIVGLAVDGGFSYFASDKMERGAMAGALAGVPDMPDFNTAPNDAVTTATSAAGLNGWTSGGANNVTVTVAQVLDPVTGQLSRNQLSVTIASDVPVFFMKLLGFKPHRESRTAVAEYLRPITFGQPGNQLGSDVNSLGTANNYYFMRSEGWGTDRGQGDAYGPNPNNTWTAHPAPTDVHALNGATEPSSQPFTMPARGGQNYQIFVPNGQHGVVQVYNPAFAPDNGLTGANGYNFHEDDGDFPETGAGCQGGGSQGTAPCSGPTDIRQWPTMSYTLYTANNPFDHTKDSWFSNMLVKSIDATGAPSGTYAVPPSTSPLPMAGLTLHHNWIDVASASSPALTPADKNLITLNNPLSTDILTSTSATGTTYRLRVDQLDNLLGDPGANGRPQNQNSQAHKGYAVRIQPTGTGCTLCTVTALDDTTIYTPVKAGGNFSMPLISVPPEYSGRTFDLYIFDPGDVGCIKPNQCSNVITVSMPNGAIATTSANGVASGQSSEQGNYTQVVAGGAPASLQTQDPNQNPANIYNGVWVRYDISVPSDYSKNDINPLQPSTWFWNLNYTTALAAGDTITANLGFTGAPVHILTG